MPPGCHELDAQGSPGPRPLEETGWRQHGGRAPLTPTSRPQPGLGHGPQGPAHRQGLCPEPRVRGWGVSESSRAAQAPGPWLTDSRPLLLVVPGAGVDEVQRLEVPPPGSQTASSSLSPHGWKGQGPWGLRRALVPFTGAPPS